MDKFNRQQCHVPNIYGVKQLCSNQIYVVNHLPYDVIHNEEFYGEIVFSVLNNISSLKIVGFLYNKKYIMTFYVSCTFTCL